ncbi:MAG TPA: S8 family serine peptidase [Steroidobacteraceae bacterium]|nr:S8 family serine peptidase [Steroidobacteraceae bacterium]
MSERPWRVAVIDSGLAAGMAPRPIRERRFMDEGLRIAELDPIDDPNGHGSVITGIIASSPRPIELLIAQVLDRQGRTTAASVAAAVDWAGRQGAQLLHLSLGLPEDRRVLRGSIEEAISAGTAVVASSPARGAMVYPAAYRGVIRATGDARCAVDEISCLETEQAHFGGCPVSGAGAGVSRGASIGAAHVSRFIVAHVEPGSPWHVVRETLKRRAAFHGRERHSSV